MNLLMLPMLVGSGVFFSIERFPASVQPLLRVLPLTALIDALRAIVLEGQQLAAQWPRLAVLVAWTAFSYLVGLRIFRWT
jgi:ABC-2 type transport system permease protein